MAVAYAAIANGGTVLHAQRSAGASSTPTAASCRSCPPASRRARSTSSSGNLAAIREGLYRAANGPGGTSTCACSATCPPTARSPARPAPPSRCEGKEDHSWFVGYAPYDDPKIVVAVVIEAAGTGSSAAAPAVCRTIAAYSETSFDPALCGEGGHGELTDRRPAPRARRPRRPHPLRGPGARLDPAARGRRDHRLQPVRDRPLHRGRHRRRAALLPRPADPLRGGRRGRDDRRDARQPRPRGPLGVGPLGRAAGRAGHRLRRSARRPAARTAGSTSARSACSRPSSARSSS